MSTRKPREVVQGTYQAGPCHQISILIIDDDANSLAILTGFLRESGYTPLVAEDGTSGLERAFYVRPDLVLLDVLMPGIDGYETCRRLKADERTKDIPVIFMTALAAMENKLAGFEAGAVDYLSKPFQREEVLARVNVHLQIRALTRRLEEEKGFLEQRVEERTRELRHANQELATEVAERKRAEEELREASRRKDDFLAMLGHELRNPLMPIANAARVLKLIGSTDDRAQRVQATIERQVTHLSRIVDDLLEVTRVARGRIPLHKERIDWVNTVRATVEDFRCRLESNGLTLNTRLPDEPFWIAGDAGRLSQVVSNILDNACKFTDAGGSVTVGLESRHGPDGDVGVLSIRDSGIGMNAEMLTRVFDAFSQAKSDLARRGGGIGLGMALAKGLVELHGGTIQASSAGLGCGSTFTVSLPLCAKAPVQSAQNAKSVTRKGLRVLVVEDNADALETIRMVLELMGHVVDTALDGPTAVTKAKLVRPEVVICDIGLPGQMDGYAVAHAIRSDPSLRSMRLVAMTGYGEERDKRRAREAGFDVHLTKPVATVNFEQALTSMPDAAASP